MASTFSGSAGKSLCCGTAGSLKTCPFEWAAGGRDCGGGEILGVRYGLETFREWRFDLMTRYSLSKPHVQCWSLTLYAWYGTFGGGEELMVEKVMEKKTNTWHISQVVDYEHRLKLEGQIGRT